VPDCVANSHHVVVRVADGKTFTYVEVANSAPHPIEKVEIRTSSRGSVRILGELTSGGRVTTVLGAPASEALPGVLSYVECGVPATMIVDAVARSPNRQRSSWPDAFSEPLGPLAVISAALIAGLWSRSVEKRKARLEWTRLFLERYGDAYLKFLAQIETVSDSNMLHKATRTLEENAFIPGSVRSAIKDAEESLSRGMQEFRNQGVPLLRKVVYRVISHPFSVFAAEARGWQDLARPGRYRAIDNPFATHPPK
jgi:hypothetical protein